MNAEIDSVPADFLGRLVARARGEDHGVQPRLPSLFEPVHPAGAGIAADTAGLMPSGRREDFPPPAREDGDIGIRRVAPPIAARRDETAPAFGTRQHESAQLPRFDVDAKPVAATVPLFPARTALAEATGDTVSGDDESPAAGARSARADGRRVDTSAAQRQPHDVRTIASRHGETIPDVYPPAENGALLSAPVPAIMSDTHAARRLASEQSRESATADNPPVVHVTIGRVEVRAVQPAPVERRPAARGPRPMALDEYLKRRGGSR
jgi:hypothetical protein